MKIISVIISLTFLFMVLHVSNEHVGYMSNDLGSVHHAHHGDHILQGEQLYHERSERTPSHSDVDDHHHDATLLQLKTKPLVHHFSSTFLRMASLPRDVEQNLAQRGKSTGFPLTRLSLCLSKQSLLL